MRSLTIEFWDLTSLIFILNLQINHEDKLILPKNYNEEIKLLKILCWKESQTKISNENIY